MTPETYDTHADDIAMSLSDAIAARDLRVAANYADKLSTRLVSTGKESIQADTLRDLVKNMHRMLDAFSQ